MIDVAPSWIQVLLAVGMIVVVPLGIASFTWSQPLAERLRSSAARLGRFAGPIAAASFFLDTGLASATLVSVWLVVTGLVSVSALLEVLGKRSLDVVFIMRGVACAYLSFGAGWLVLSRLGIRPLDFTDAVVELTAVHFHFAGFAAPLIAASAVSWMKARERSASFLGLAGLGVIAAMPVIALGTTFSSMLAALGALLLGLSLFVIAIVTLASIVPLMNGKGARLLLTASSISILIGMLLGIQYGLGQWLGTPSLGIARMAQIHGTLNALGFSLCGLVGWRLAARSREAKT